MSKNIKYVHETLNYMYNKNCDYKQICRNGRLVVSFWFDGGKLKVSHYGTCILEYDIVKDEILKFDGWSCSDRDILNNVLNFYASEEPRFSVSGGQLHQIKNENRLQAEKQVYQ